LRLRVSSRRLYAIRRMQPYVANLRSISYSYPGRLFQQRTHLWWGGLRSWLIRTCHSVAMSPAPSVRQRCSACHSSGHGPARTGLSLSRVEPAREGPPRRRDTMRRRPGAACACRARVSLMVACLMAGRAGVCGCRPWSRLSSNCLHCRTPGKQPPMRPMQPNQPETRRDFQPPSPTDANDDST
jgi:hypothetical protein